MLWAVWVLVLCGVQLWRLNHFAYTGFDLAIYTQTYWNLTHGGGFFSSIQDHTYLSDHLEPILLVFWPFMKLWFSPLWLLWGQTLILASSIFPLYRLTRRVLSERQALILPALFLLHTTVWNTATIEFHALALAMPLILWVCVLLEEGKTRWWLWLSALILLALVREEMGLVVMGFGLLAVIKKCSWKWWLPAFAIGAAWTGLAQWIQSWFVDSYRYSYYFPWIDLLREGHYSAALATMWDLLFRVYMLRMIVAPVLALGLVWVLAAEWLIPAIPIILSFALLDAGVSNALIEGYHATVPFTLFWVALPFGLQRTQKLLKKKMGGLTVPYAVLLCIVAPAMLSTWFFLWRLYPSGNQEYKPDEIQIFLQHIQPEDAVASSAAFFPALSQRSTLQATWYIFRQEDEFLQAPYELNPKVKWILFDTHEFFDLRTQRDWYWQEQQKFVELLSTQFKPVDSLGAVVLFERTDVTRQRASALAQLLQYESGTPDAIPAEFVKAYSDRPMPIVIPGPSTQLIGNHLYLDLYLANPSRWKGLEQQMITPIIRIQQGAEELTVPLGYGLISPDTVQTGDHMQMNIVLPERMLRAGRSKSELQITGELIELKGLSYGRHQSIIQPTQWVETFLDMTLPIE